MDWNLAMNEFFVWFPTPLLSFLGGACTILVWHWFFKDRFRFERHHTERIQAIKSVYGLILKLEDSMNVFLLEGQNPTEYGVGKKHNAERWSRLRSEFEAAVDNLRTDYLFSWNRIFFEPNLARRIDEFLRLTWLHVWKYELHASFAKALDRILADEEPNPAIPKISELRETWTTSIEPKIKRLKWEIEMECRFILNPSPYRGLLKFLYVLGMNMLSPNHWSLLRIAMGLATPALVYWQAPLWLVLAWLAVAMITDYIDGAVARACGLVSDTGKWLDPLADKIVYLPLFALWVWEGRADIWWVAVLALADFTGTVARPWLTASATMWGKSKTCLAFALVLWMVAIPTEAYAPVEYAAGWLLALLAVVSVISKVPRRAA